MRSDLTPDLDLITDAAASALKMWNLRHCEELARFAHDRGGGLRAAIVLAEAMVWQGRTAEADKVLADVDLKKAPVELVTAHGCLSANATFFGGQVEQARRELVDLKGRVEPGRGTAMIAAMEVVFAYLSGDVDTTIELGLALCAGDAPPMVRALASAPTCWALASVGRASDLHRTADVSLRASPFGQSGPLQLIVGVAEVMASTAAGDFTAAERIVERYATMPSANSLHAVLNAMTGIVKLGRGALPSACSALQNSLSAMPSESPFAWSMVVAAWTAQAEGARGNLEATAAALRRSEIAYGPHTAAFLPELELARAWERAAANDLVAAREHSLRAAETARQSGMFAVEMSALHTAVRFGDQSCAARVSKLANLLKTALSEAVAAHARGVTNRDGDLLDTAARRFADLGALASAADAAAQAAAEHARKGHRGKEVESSVRAYGLARQCGLHTPTVAATARPLPITSREAEIADLVAAGLSNRQVADRLVISVRTTEGHLYRIFAKLGINSRDQLIHLLDLNRLGAKGTP
jgi:DNA-binding CsgD family transcriptional regulator